jgi:glycosyltransferase involved in cell wall biosynthesis
VKTIFVIIPCHNEEAGLAAVLAAMPREKLAAYGFHLEILVVDNRSTDRTAAVAQTAGVNVLPVPVPGKGNVVRQAFAATPENADYVVILDGDNTYKPAEILRMVEPIDAGFCHAVVGSRLGGRLRHHSLRLSNRIYNWLVTFFVRTVYFANVTDVLSGFWAFRRDVVTALAPNLTATGFEIEMELITKMVRLGFAVHSVPITYERREGTSKISAIRDGLRILGMYVRNLLWKPDRKLLSKALQIGSLLT